MKHPILLSFTIVFLVFGFLVGLFAFVIALSRGNISSSFSGGQVAVVKIEGPIFDSGDTIEELEDYFQDDSVKAIVLRIDSPGGAAAPSQEIYEEVRKIKAKKPVVISMGTVAASGGYYIAAAGSEIFANPGTITGSIGVIMESLNFEKLFEWAKLENQVIKSGKFKDVGSPFRKMTAEEKAYLQNILDNMYLQFMKAVADNRGFTPEKMSELAQGKIYTG